VTRWVGPFLVVAIVAGAIAFFTLKGSFIGKKVKPATIAESNTKKLGIERPERTTAAPDFALDDLTGKRVTLKKQRGKVVFLNFWATWCPPCIQEMPTMEKLHQDLGEDGLVILAINFQETPDQVKEFFSEHNFTFTALLDRDGKVFELYQAWALPMSAIVNKRGELVGKVMGYRDWHGEEARQLFQRLLAEES
jgi:cytochrome c biogenesis protein CcmG, thiol:disulfide interchange protein DsbE